MKANIRNIYQLRAYLQVQRIIYLLMVVAYVKALKSREKPEILSTIDVPFAMAIDTYRNYIAVKGVNESRTKTRTVAKGVKP